MVRFIKGSHLETWILARVLLSLGECKVFPRITRLCSTMLSELLDKMDTILIPVEQHATHAITKLNCSIEQWHFWSLILIYDVKRIEDNLVNIQVSSLKFVQSLTNDKHWSLFSSVGDIENKQLRLAVPASTDAMLFISQSHFSHREYMKHWLTKEWPHLEESRKHSVVKKRPIQWTESEQGGLWSNEELKTLSANVVTVKTFTCGWGRISW